MITKRTLPFDPQPPIKAFSFWGNYLGILQGHGHNVNGLLYNYYITLFYSVATNHLGYVFGLRAKWLFKNRRFKVPRKNPFNYIERCINEEKYVTIMLNAKFLSNVTFDREWYHDWMIYGYDKEERMFEAVGFIVDTSCHAFNYETIQISYDDFLQALPPIGHKVRYNFLSWLPKNFRMPEYNENLLRFELFLYTHNLLPFFFNAQIYLLFSKVFRYKNMKNNDPFDLRGFKVLCEHKRVIMSMMNDLALEGEAAKEFERIIRIANTIQTTALKYNVTKHNKQKAIDTICDALQKLRAEEPEIIRKFYLELKEISKLRK